ncbi:TetR/AcrR family transcriptional regulator [Verrucosispora sp. WMMA2121]|uniref:TetR/AcrR family transcriptional regulator n=1 Tax=Verrucosispora sp. WMMA2121 TaxID=3015164 RepID=UPI0022B74B80|nr:TetR/AcrR family transcriptional regulator [Verrucosispora sp. WMMA2121]MCZ7422134.1 TetR/AcrR family transcriptional regulator [Verrucosispora sp. WMMA2121]
MKRSDSRTPPGTRAASANRLARRRMTAEERRREILHTAANLFDDRGYASTTMDDIAEVVGVAKATLYHYFQSKDEILHWIHDELIELLVSRHQRRLGAGLGPDQLLLEVMADILELMETHRGHVRVFFEHFRELPASAQDNIREKRQRYDDMVLQVFTDGIGSGVFRDVDVRLASFAAYGMCNWAYQWYEPRGALRSREVAYQFWSYLVRGLAPDQKIPDPANRRTHVSNPPAVARLDGDAVPNPA